MYKALGDFDGGNGYTNLSFREPERWNSMSVADGASRVAGTALHSSGVVFGDEESGPALLLLALGAGVTPPDAPAHSHASDSWRISLLGNLPMGPDRYDPGEFTFRQGWKPYASDNYAHGPDGGWTALIFGDRRGMRVRHVRHEGPAITKMDGLLAEWMGVGGDLVSDDPDAAPGASSLATTLDDTRRGPRINGSFDDTAQWMSFEGFQAMVGALGQKENGPLILHTKIRPGEHAFGGVQVESDVLRLVVRGSFSLDAHEYVAGDMRVQSAGVPFGEATAGPDGLDEVVVISDRRTLVPGAFADQHWGAGMAKLLDDVTSRFMAN